MPLSSTPPAAQSLQRALQLMEVLIDGRGAVSLPTAAGMLGIKTSTAYRLAAELQRAGILIRTARGRYSGGLALHRLARADDINAIVVAIARPFLKALSARTGRVAHLGIFEDDMVTYLIREAPFEAEIFTREGMQLEAYCTAVGKVLLAGLPAFELEKYIETGQFVPLTPQTLIDPQCLRRTLALAREQGFARDDEESNAGLHCVAVPLPLAALDQLYALSLSGSRARGQDSERLLSACRDTAMRLSAELGRRPTDPAVTGSD